MVRNFNLFIIIVLLNVLSSCDSSQVINNVGNETLVIKTYNNFTIRANIYKKYNKVLPDKLLIAEYYVERGELPTVDFINKSLYENDDFSYNQKTGEIKVFFTAADSDLIKQKSITITAILDYPNFILWKCTGDLPEEVEIRECNQPYNY